MPRILPAGPAVLVRRSLLAASLALAGLALGVVGSDRVPGPRGAVAQDAAAKALDRVTLSSGRVVEGRILEETADTLRIMVVMMGIEAPTSYPRSEILKIERGVVVAAGAPDETAGGDRDDFGTRTRAGADGPVVYHLKLEGMLIPDSGIRSFPQEPVIAPSALTKALEDAASHHPEVVVLEYDVTAASGLNGVLLVEEYGEVVEPFIASGMRIVFWVENAEGGASLLPFSSPEIFFKPDARLGGLGAVGEISSGDEWVDKKLLSAALGHAVGMAIKGGYSPEIIRAMCVESNWLAVRFDGGRPAYLEYEPRPADGEGWIILADNGEGKNADDETKLDRNDVLNLDADWAYRLGVSKGAFDDIDDLLWEIGVDDGYVVEEGRGTSILERSAEQVERTFDSFIRLQEELEDLGRGRDSAARQLNILKRISGLLAAQAEVLDPAGSQRAQIEIQIEQLQLQIRQANDRGRNRR